MSGEDEAIQELAERMALHCWMSAEEARHAIVTTLNAYSREQATVRLMFQRAATVFQRAATVFQRRHAPTPWKRNVHRFAR